MLIFIEIDFEGVILRYLEDFSEVAPDIIIITLDLIVALSSKINIHLYEEKELDLTLFVIELVDL